MSPVLIGNLRIWLAHGTAAHQPATIRREDAIEIAREWADKHSGTQKSEAVRCWIVAAELEQTIQDAVNHTVAAFPNQTPERAREIIAGDLEGDEQQQSEAGKQS